VETGGEGGERRGRIEGKLLGAGINSVGRNIARLAPFECFGAQLIEREMLVGT